MSGGPDINVIEDMIAEGDKVATRLSASGRHESDLPGIAATGARLMMQAVAIHRLANGGIIEHWSARDDLALMRQLGVEQ